MILRHKGEKSTQHLMPGGSPQGALLGVLLYLVYVSDIGMDLPSSNKTETSRYNLDSVTLPLPPALMESEARLKFIDDLSLAESVDLKTQLSKEPELIGPREFHDRNGLVLLPTKSKLQTRLDEITIAANNHEMKLNLKKSKIMPFNFTRKYDFLPTYSLENTPMEVVYSMKPKCLD